MLYHPELDGVVDKGDVDVENLTSYVDLIGENQFHAILKKIPKIIKSSFKVWLLCDKVHEDYFWIQSFDAKKLIWNKTTWIIGMY